MLYVIRQWNAKPIVGWDTVPPKGLLKDMYDTKFKGKALRVLLF